MKKPTIPSKVIIIPQTPQNNSKQEVAPQSHVPTENQAPAPTPVKQQAEAEDVEEVEEEEE